MTKIMIKQYDNHKRDVIVERYGYSHAHRNVTPSSVNRLAHVTRKNNGRFITRKRDHVLTTIDIH